MTWFLHSVESISLADGVQLLTFIFALILFWVDVRRRRIEDAKSLRTQRIEIYQRLEIESNAVFKFEAENRTSCPSSRPVSARPPRPSSPAPTRTTTGWWRANITRIAAICSRSPPGCAPPT